MAIPYSSPLGVNDTKATFVTSDYFIMVGVENNPNPGAAVDTNGAEIPKNVTLASGGQVNVSSSMPKYRQVDTGHIFETGNFVLHAGNKVALSCGGGGIRLDTSGTVNINGGSMISLNTGGTVDFISDTIQFTTKSGVRFSGGSVHLDGESTSVSGKFDVGTNLKVPGGLSVQGEAFLTHMTTQRQVMETEDAGPATGHLNPMSSWAIMPGKSTVAPILGISNLLTPLESFTVTVPPEMVPMNMIFMMPTVLPGMSVPIPILVTAMVQFPTGFHLISNGAAESEPDAVSAIAAFAAAKAEPPTAGMGDFAGPSHSHMYVIPACTLVDSTDEVWSAAKACDSNEAVSANAMQPFGMTVNEYLKKSAEKAVKRQVENNSFYKRLKKFFGFD